MKGAHLDVVAAGYSACVLDSGCQVAALSQGLKHATCGIVVLAHLQPQAALLDCAVVGAPLLLEEAPADAMMQEGDAVWLVCRQVEQIGLYFQTPSVTICSQISACQGAQDLARAGVLHQRHRGGVD